jgi:hypothetical protein
MVTAVAGKAMAAAARVRGVEEREAAERVGAATEASAAPEERRDTLQRSRCILPYWSRPRKAGIPGT